MRQLLGVMSAVMGVLFFTTGRKIRINQLPVWAAWVTDMFFSVYKAKNHNNLTITKARGKIRSHLELFDV
jgi:hypothetical protein